MPHKRSAEFYRHFMIVLRNFLGVSVALELANRCGFICVILGLPRCPWPTLDLGLLPTHANIIAAARSVSLMLSCLERKIL